MTQNLQGMKVYNDCTTNEKEEMLMLEEKVYFTNFTIGRKQFYE